MTARKINKPVAMVSSMLLTVFGWVIGVIAFVQDFGNIKINEFLVFAGIAITGLGIVLTGLCVLGIVIDIIRNR